MTLPLALAPELRRYRGPVLGVIFDWAGTMVDFGSCAPVHAFAEVFRSRGVEVPGAVIRAPMGLHKREHIRTIASDPAIAAAWQAACGVPPSEADVEAMYQAFVPIQIAWLRKSATLIPGALALFQALRSRGIRVGSTTGYTAEMMAELVPLAAAQGYSPECVVSASEVPTGRPAPWMCFRNAERLGVYPMAAWVKIGDTPADVDEGRSAGMWTVGLAACGNEVGLPEAELRALPEAEQKVRTDRARARLHAAGADYVVDGPSEVLGALAAIEARLQRGERPNSF